MHKITNLDKQLLNAEGQPMGTTIKNTLISVLNTLEGSDIPTVLRVYNKLVPAIKTAKKEIEIEDADYEIVKAGVSNWKAFLFAKAQVLEALGEK